MGNNMATQEEKQAYVDEMARKRGYVLDYHKVMTAYDYEVLQAANGLVEAAYLKERRLDRKTKELLFILSLTVMLRVGVDLYLDLAARLLLDDLLELLCRSPLRRFGSDDMGEFDGVGAFLAASLRPAAAGPAPDDGKNRDQAEQ